MEGGHDGVSDLGGPQRGYGRVGVADFADENNVRSLAQGLAEALREGFGVQADFALGEEGNPVGEEVFDGIFNCNDVPGQMLRDPAEGRSDRRGFSGGGRPAHQNESAFFAGPFPEQVGGQTECVEIGHLGFDMAQNGPATIEEAEEIHPKAEPVCGRVGAVRVAGIRSGTEREPEPVHFAVSQNGALHGGKFSGDTKEGATLIFNVEIGARLFDQMSGEFIQGDESVFGHVSRVDQVDGTGHGSANQDVKRRCHSVMKTMQVILRMGAATVSLMGGTPNALPQTGAPLPLPDRIEIKEDATLPAGIPERAFNAWIVDLGENEVTVELSRFRGITSRVRIDRGIIAKLEAGDPAERPFAELAPFLSPPPDAADAGSHRTTVMTRLVPFLERFSETPQAELVREARDLYEGELLRLAGGEVKINHRWFPVNALEPMDHETLKMLRETAAAAGEPVQAFGSRVTAAARLSPSEFFPELAQALDATARRRMLSMAQAGAQTAVSAARLQATLTTREAVLIGQIEAIVNQEPLGGTVLRPATVVDRIYNETTGKWFRAAELNTSLFTEFMIPDGRPKRALSQAEVGRLREMVDQLATVRQASGAPAPPKADDGLGQELAALAPLRRIDVSALEESVRAVQEVQDRVRAGLNPSDGEVVALLAASTKTVRGGTAHLRLAKEMPQHAAAVSEEELTRFTERAALALKLSAMARESLPGTGAFRDSANAIPAAWQGFLDETALPRFVAAADEMPPDEWAERVASFTAAFTEHRAALAPDAGKKWAGVVLRRIRDGAAQEAGTGDAALALRRLAALSALLAKPDLIASHERTALSSELENIRRRVRTRLLQEEAPVFRARLQELADARDYQALHDSIRERWRKLAVEKPEPDEIRAFSDLALEHAAAALTAFSPLQSFHLVSLARDIEPGHSQIKLWISGGVVGVFALLMALALPAFWILSLIATHFDNLRFKFRVGALRKPKRTVLPKS